jgi:hypothetical protein
MSVTYSECVPVALVIHHAVRMLRVNLYLWPPWFYHYLTNGTILVETIIERKKCVWNFSTKFA